MKPRVFISHSSMDDAFVDRLARDLRGAGIRVWVDDATILPGDDIIAKIEDGLSSATHVLVVLSPSSHLSKWVAEETHAAQLRSITSGTRLIPVLWGKFDVRSIPILLQHHLYADFRREQEYELSLASLLGVFRDPSRPLKPSSRLRIDDINFLTTDDGSEFALEVLLRNIGQVAVTTRRLSIRSSAEEYVSYFSPPPTMIFPVRVALRKPRASGVALIDGTVGQESDIWRRGFTGALMTEPYSTKIALDMPLYARIEPAEDAVIRIPFTRAKTVRPPMYLSLTRRTARRSKEPMVPNSWWRLHWPSDPTRVTITLTGGKTVSRAHAEAMVYQLLALRPKAATTKQ